VLEDPIQFPALLETLLINSSYAGVLLVLLLTGCGLPVPEDITLLIAGWLCAREICELHLMLPLTFVAVVGADLMMYGIGRRYGHYVPRLPIIRHYLSEARLKKAVGAYHRHGGKMLFAARFMPGLRTPLFFTAGTFGVPVWKFLLFDGMAALLSVPALVLLGWWFADHLHVIRAWVEGVELVLVGALLLALLGFAGWRFFIARRESFAPGPAGATPPPTRAVGREEESAP